MKGMLSVSIDTEVLALIKQREDITNVSNFIEQLFRVELDLKSDQDNKLGELKLMNAKLSAEIEKARIEIRSLKKQIEKPVKEDEKHDYTFG